MGATRDNFFKFPRTPHLFGSRGTKDDRHLGERVSAAFISEPGLIVSEKIDGTNVGIHFTPAGDLVLQCRGHEITGGMHPQYDLFKNWVSVKRPVLEAILGDRYILFGEWLYARHSVHYRRLPHYFFEFDLYDKEAAGFLSLSRRMQRLEGSGITTAPILHQGSTSHDALMALIDESSLGAHFDNPITGRTDTLMEGLYLRTESDGLVTKRAKIVRPEFVEKIKQSEHWQHQPMVPNELKSGADIWE